MAKPKVGDVFFDWDGHRFKVIEVTGHIVIGQCVHGDKIAINDVDGSFKIYRNIDDIKEED